MICREPIDILTNTRVIDDTFSSAADGDVSGSVGIGGNAGSIAIGGNAASANANPHYFYGDDTETEAPTKKRGSQP